jgi:hypothetical protein
MRKGPSEDGPFFAVGSDQDPRVVIGIRRACLPVPA